ncbi:MAG: type II toxin-antitoxin system Phd/YefM family antitoxin [Aeromicrobium sp.]|uniref:type II toxin-antitoxin system Phd/YefM family antitoxin n=1 Tax=Aeromicrobium sp. TaxID=1871063 RepID=UPI0039E3AA42
MRTVTLTQLNQRTSAITREIVESGEPVQVTNRGKVVLRMIPEVPPAQDRLAELIALGLARPAVAPGQWQPRRKPATLSRPIDEILDEVRADHEV